MDSDTLPPAAIATPQLPTQEAEPSLPSSLPLGQPSTSSIDLTGDSDNEEESSKAPKSQAPPQQSSRPFPSFAQSSVGLNGMSGHGQGTMNGHEQANRSPSATMGTGPFSQYAGQGQPSKYSDYRPFFSSGPLQHPPPNFGSHSNPHLNGGMSGQFNTNGMSYHPSPSASSNHFHPAYNGNGSPTIYTPRTAVPHPSPTNNGASSSAPIDFTSDNIPSPPRYEPKQPIFIGAITTECFMLYPSPVVYLGGQSHDPSERLELVRAVGAEFLKVKLKYRKAGTKPKHGAQWTTPEHDVVQVFTPDLTSYIGDIQTSDTKIETLLCEYLAGGLCRLEGYIMRLQPDQMPCYRVRVNVMFFTLPANIDHFSRTLETNNLYLFDPVPSYVPGNHAASPPYFNPHGGGHLSVARANKARVLLHGAGMGMGGYQFPPDRVNQKEVTRQQVDAIYSSVQTGGELDHSDPGPNIKTELFPHQKKALTFLLEREQDLSSLKKARKANDKSVKKALAKLSKNKDKGKNKEAPTFNGSAHVNAPDAAPEDKESGEGGADGEKEQDGSTKDDPAVDDVKRKYKIRNRSLWKPTLDAKGKVKSYRHKITQDEIQVKKGDPPPDCKGAILADDMGLGKTLSIVSLIAATRQAAMRFSKAEIAAAPTPEEGKPELDPNTIKTKVFGMPDMPDLDEKGKKRKRDDEPIKLASTLLRSRGTLLVCPMSTISNWEDQIREHWNGDVEVIGGASGQMVKPPEKVWKAPKRTKKGESSEEDDLDEFDALKIYVYHGPSRTPDPAVIADFDIVITSYNTLANEYSKSGGASCEDTPADTANNSDEEYDTGLNTGALPVKPDVEAEIKANEVAEALRKKKKSAKGSAVKAPERSPLQSIQWFRVVLDEAHYIKTAATVASRASCAVDADRRIALTGTPIQNKIEDIWALFRFLRMKPFDEKSMFTDQISKPCKVGDAVGVARLQVLMGSCTLRRTKDSTAEDGRRILNLPARKEVQLWLDLREDERAIYEERKAQGQAELRAYTKADKGDRNYAHVLQQLLRLRQTCNHIDLPTMDVVEEDFEGTIMDYEVAVNGINLHGLTQNRGVSVVCFLKDSESAVCSECNFDYNDYFPSLAMAGIEDAKPDTKPKKKLNTSLLLTKCLHVYCPKCFKGSVHSGYTKRMKDTATRACGICQTMLRLPSDVAEILPPDSAEALVPVVEPKQKRKRYVRPPGEMPNLSTKMQFLHNELIQSSKRNPNSKNYDPYALAMSDEIEDVDQDGKPYLVKSVVFSQWTTMLDRIGDMLDEAQIRYSRLDGTMTREDRAKACDDLKYNKKVEVLLVSTRAGGVGLNLTTASRCFLVDPNWNPSVEAQAIDRIHRMGQTRPVQAIKLMIKDSVEEKLDKLQRKKANLAKVSLTGMTSKELMEQKKEEMAELFS